MHMFTSYASTRGVKRPELPVYEERTIGCCETVGLMVTSTHLPEGHHVLQSSLGYDINSICGGELWKLAVEGARAISKPTPFEATEMP